MASQSAPPGQKTPPAEPGGSQSSPFSTMPLPHTAGCVLVVLVDVVVGASVVELVVGGMLHWQLAVQADSGGQKAPPAEPGGSHCSPASMMPLPQTAGCVDDVLVVVLVDVVLAAVEVVVGGMLHWQVAVQADSAGQKAPPTDPGGSHCSPDSTMPLPQRAGAVVVVVLVLVVDEPLIVVVEVVGGASVVVVGAPHSPSRVTRSDFTSFA